MREALIRRAPAEAPEHDPLERQHPLPPDGEFCVASAEERLLFQFLRDAPYLPTAGDLGAATSAVTPWPHQLQVARTLVNRFPDRALLADEVGLGKTIEAGLVIRQLLLSGRVQRCLILTPAAVLRQWQEELYEKFNLDIPRYHAGQLYDARGNPIGSPSDNPWDEQDLLLASSHLAKRKERVPQLLAARPWDLLVVDEAHHARRKDFLQPLYRPNSLLTLLNRLKEQEQYAGLLLLTATPMQVHPVEVWDLLTILGLGGRWGADEHNFLGFFAELRRSVPEADWNFVFDLVADYLQSNGQNGDVDPHFFESMRAALGAPHASAIRDLPLRQGQRQTTIHSLPKVAHPYVREMARHHTPLRRYLFRNTRKLLREYVDKGLLQANVPWRRPEIRRVAFLPEEAELYQRITEYISEFYSRYENERRGLGFIMTVYRRRLTSSFYAARKSLERRRDWLLGQLEFGDAFTLEDEADLEELDELEQAGLDLVGLDPQQPLTPGQVAHFQAELDYLDNFIIDLQSLSQGDSKITQLKDELNRIFRERPTVIIFTQYTDTMDYLREQLQTVYRGQIACYSGRGGEIWQGMTWLPTSKELVKNRFRDGEIKILLATESASEGLNLQTCGVLINYDMPWNPMRVEQRIGRIDRIGQKYNTVWIYNYFYRDTIEDRIYQALQDRIHWFEDVVGMLQPILADVNKVTRDLAMLPAERQATELDEAIRRLREQIDRAEIEALNLDEYARHDEPNKVLHTPVSLADLESALVQLPATRHLFQQHPEIADAYWLRWRGEPLAVTFSASRFDQHPETLHFLSYGSPLLAEVLAAVPEPESYPPHLARFVTSEPWPLHAWYDLRPGQTRPVTSMAGLQAALRAEDAAISEQQHRQAEQQFAREAETLTGRYNQRVAQQGQQQRSALQAKARRLLEQAALVEIALGQQTSLYEPSDYPTSFTGDAVRGLARRGAVWQWLLVIASDEHSPLPLPTSSATFYQQIRHEQPATLKERFSQLAEEAKPLVRAWQALDVGRAQTDCVKMK